MRKSTTLALSFFAMAAFGFSMVTTAVEAKAETPSKVNFAEPEAPGSGEEKRDGAESAQNARENARTIFKEMKTVWDGISKAAKEGNANIAKIENPRSPEGSAAARKIVMEYRKFQSAEMAKIKGKPAQFLELYKKVEFKDWDLKSDAGLLNEGLYQSGMEAMKDEKPALAMEAFEKLLEVAKGHRNDKNALAYLPRLIQDMDNYKGAKVKMDNLIKVGGEENAVSIAYEYGNFEMIWGNADAAQELWAAALEEIKKTAKEGAQPSRTQRGLEQRIALVGKTAPDVDSDTWLGGEAQPLSKMVGKVVIIDFWATWCPPCIRSMPALNDMRNEYVKKGVEVLGVTRVYGNGKMPESMDDLRKGKLGKTVRGIEPEGFVAHVQKFRDNTKCDYPFVIAEASDFSNYKVGGIPTMAIVDQKGKIAAYFVGGGNESKIERVVKRLLGDKAEHKGDGGAKEEGSKEEPKKESPKEEGGMK